jgi:hypothetical protein
MNKDLIPPAPLSPHNSTKGQICWPPTTLCGPDTKPAKQFQNGRGGSQPSCMLKSPGKIYKDTNTQAPPQMN